MGPVCQVDLPNLLFLVGQDAIFNLPKKFDPSNLPCLTYESRRVEPMGQAFFFFYSAACQKGRFFQVLA